MGTPSMVPGSHQGCLYMYIYKPPELRGAEKTGVCRIDQAEWLSKLLGRVDGNHAKSPGPGATKMGEESTS